MRTVRLPAREGLEQGVCVTAILVDAACRRRMQPDPFVESDLLRRNQRYEIAPVLETIVKIVQRLPEKASNDWFDRLLALVLVPDAPHPRADGTIRQGLEKMRGGER